MARARNGLIDLSATPYYHVISRCIRRVFLCGEGKCFGKRFHHRHDWVLERLKSLSSIFASDIRLMRL